MVTKESLNAVLNHAPPAGEYDTYAKAWVYLVSAKDGETTTTASVTRALVFCI
jgi:hypothetical protein